MRVLLIQPDSAEEINREYLSLQFPLPLGYLAAAARQAGTRFACPTSTWSGAPRCRRY